MTGKHKALFHRMLNILTLFFFVGLGARTGARLDSANQTLVDQKADIVFVGEIQRGGLDAVEQRLDLFQALRMSMRERIENIVQVSMPDFRQAQTLRDVFFGW